MPKETDDDVRALKGLVQTTQAEPFDKSSYAMTGKSKEWLQDALSLPQNLIEDDSLQPIQNADGSFVFMLDYDGLGEAPLG